MGGCKPGSSLEVKERYEGLGLGLGPAALGWGAYPAACSIPALAIPLLSHHPFAQLSCLPAGSSAPQEHCCSLSTALQPLPVPAVPAFPLPAAQPPINLPGHPPTNLRIPILHPQPTLPPNHPSTRPTTLAPPACLPLQLARVREEASLARSEAGRARAEAEFERDRSSRLAESVEMQRQQVESMMTSAAKYQVRCRPAPPCPTPLHRT